ncbi:TPA: transcription termination/antitermination protein NusA [Candidatus Galligastranaerophilus faecipullorum]|nr:transcription termination/antitermination protein NusA [Candidatus Galligastranaerophilus faecipullorum]
MIKIGTALFEAAEQLEREKGISKDVLVSSLCDALVAAYKKHIRDKDAENVEAILDESTGEIGVFRTKVVVEEVENEDLEISLEDAKEIDEEVEIDDEVKIEVTPENFGRIAAQSAKQVITQRIREAERKLVLDEFLSKKGTLITGIIQRRDERNVIVNIGKTDAIMPSREQIPGEYYKPGNRIRVFVLDVKETSRLPQVIVSQAHPEIVRELFELEVPEIEDGIVEIKSIAREAGFRTKLAVWSNDPSVDSVGACIGPRGSRIQTIVGELKNEKIDIVRYSQDPVEYIVNALSPARIISVDILADDENRKEVFVIVPDDQLSLAIGREGQNVRLAHRLTGWKIDIKSETQARAMEDEREKQMLEEMKAQEEQQEQAVEQEVEQVLEEDEKVLGEAQDEVQEEQAQEEDA